MAVELVPARTKHVGRIARLMRAADRREVEAIGMTAKQALRFGVLNSTEAWTFLKDGLPEAMAGYTVLSELTGEATAWFLATDEAAKHARMFLTFGPQLIARMADSRRTLSNVVDEKNRAAIRLMERWGFKLDRSAAYESNGVRLIPFSLEP